MLIGHLPAGYLLTRRIERALHVRGWLWLGLVASVFPDVDLFWFYLVDHRRAQHHHYWIHRPFVWALIALGWFAVAAAARAPRLRIAGWIVLPNIFLHLLLDTIVGRIDWLYPWKGRGYSLFDVPATYKQWYFTNYFLHWTFVFEVIIVAWALAVLVRARAARGST
jgi:inner membrane protein